MSLLRLRNRLYAAYQSRVAKFWFPLTTFKGLYLTLTGGRRGRVDRQIWGAGGQGAKVKQL